MTSGENKIIRTVCFTGHRDMARGDALRLPMYLEEVILEMMARGATVFRAGGAMGFDTMAALKVLDLQAKYPELELELILPCRDQTNGWDETAIRTYEYILKRSTRHSFLFDTYVQGCLLERDRHLVDGSDVCVAFCTRSRGGTAYTCAYALKQRVELVNLWDRMKAL